MSLVLTMAWAALALGVQGYLWFARPDGVPVNALPRAPLQLPRDGGDARLVQTFRVDADGLEQIALYPRVIGSGRPAGHVTFTLSDVTDRDAPRVVTTMTVKAGDVAAGVNGRYVLRFPAVPDSRGHSYSLDIAIGSSEPDGRAQVAFASVADNKYRDGTLLVNGRPEWGDLAFEARATTDTPFRRFVAFGPVGWLPRTPAFWLVLLAVYDAACAVGLSLLIVRRRPSSVQSPAG